METTIHVADALLLEGEAIAAREGITSRELVEQGLRLALAQRQAAPPPDIRAALDRG